MERLKQFFRTSVLGGVAVMLPIAITVFIFRWLYRLITDVIQPLTDMVIARSQLAEIVADIVVILLIVMICFVVGAIVRTKIGKYIQENLDDHLLKIAPGYTMIKETVLQFLGRKKSPFSSVALVKVFGDDTLMTAFITDEHPSDMVTVFVPTGPNPTTGFIFHLKKDLVYPVPVSVEKAIRSVISCGTGSGPLIEKFLSQKPSPANP